MGWGWGGMEWGGAGMEWGGAGVGRARRDKKARMELRAKMAEEIWWCCAPHKNSQFVGTTLVFAEKVP